MNKVKVSYNASGWVVDKLSWVISESLVEYDYALKMSVNDKIMPSKPLIWGFFVPVIYGFYCLCVLFMAISSFLLILFKAVHIL